MVIVQYENAPSIPITQVLLDRCATALNCARMTFRASTLCWEKTLKGYISDKGKVTDISPFSFKVDIILSMQIKVKSLIILPFPLKVKLFHQFIQILSGFWVELLISLCLTSILLRNLLQKFCQVLS